MRVAGHQRKGNPLDTNAALEQRIRILTGILIQLHCRHPHRLPGLCAHIASMPNTAALVMVVLAGAATYDLRTRGQARYPGGAYATLVTLNEDGSRADVDDVPPDALACGRMLAAMSVGDTDTAFALAEVATQKFSADVPLMLAHLTGYAHDVAHSG